MIANTTPVARYCTKDLIEIGLAKCVPFDLDPGINVGKRRKRHTTCTDLVIHNSSLASPEGDLENTCGEAISYSYPTPVARLRALGHPISKQQPTPKKKLHPRQQHTLQPLAQAIHFLRWVYAPQIQSQEREQIGKNLRLPKMPQLHHGV